MAGILKSAKKVWKIAHIWRVTSQTRVGAERFSLEEILIIMVRNWHPHPISISP